MSATTTMTAPAVTVTPLAASHSAISFGVAVAGVDVENLTDSQFETIHKALFENQVVLLKNQSSCSPRAQYELTRRFDPESTSYGHGKTLDAKRSVLHPDLKTIPHQPQVQVIGNGTYESYEGLNNFTLKHPHHATFHKTRISEADDFDNTRFYRWHIDAALYGMHPPLVTTLLAVKVPQGRTQTLRYDDNSGDEMTVPLGTTAFVSGETMFDILSPEDKKFVETSRIEYAAHPYIWMSGASAMSDGLGLVSEGKELTADQLPPIEQDKIQILPFLWRNPETGRKALQVHPCAIRRIHLADGSTIDDLEEVRSIVHRLQRPGIAPEHVYAHDWEEGDLVLFNNHGVLHSVVGAFTKDEQRLFRQCNLAASRPPLE